MVWLAAVIAVLLIALTALLWGESPPWVIMMNAVLVVVIPASLVIASRVQVDVTADACIVRWGPAKWPVQSIPWSRVSDVSVVDVDAWQWGGWGYRWAPGGRGVAALVRRGPGITLTRRDETPLTVTVDDAEAGCAAARLALASGAPQAP